MPIKSLDDLFIHFLKDIYYAENKVAKELPKMAKKATAKKLKTSFTNHEKETMAQIDILKHVFKLIDVKPESVKCKAIEGIIAETNHIISETKDDATRDVALIACAQAVEHYEINRYGTLITYAQQLGHKDAVDLLRENLQQEAKADRHLSELAGGGINKKAT
ncbi:MAG: ferritin-like domain-containing protein [Hyphomicrobiaceae bacterium]